MITHKLIYLVGKISGACSVCSSRSNIVFHQKKLLSSWEMKKAGVSKSLGALHNSKSSAESSSAALEGITNQLQNVHLSTFAAVSGQKKERKHSKQRNRRLSTSGDNSLQVKTLNDVAEYIKNPSTRKIVVMAGAGISTPSGIPDFRTPGTGLYDNLHKYNLPYPEAIFELHHLHKEPRAFFTLAKELYPGNYKPNEAHYFVKLLHDKGKLLRMYTQNIDGLERLAGIPSEKLVEAHGTFETATCIRCGKHYKGDDIKNEIFAGEIPKCMKNNCGGIIKPDIVFFGEQLPERFWLHAEDMTAADLLIVMGTSLVVEPFASIAELIGKQSPRLLMNKAKVGTFAYGERCNDVVEKGDVAECVKKLANLLGWAEELNALSA